MIKKLLMGARLPMLGSALALTPLFVGAAEPVAPTNLGAKVNGMVVDLSWEWGNAGEAVLSSDFEWDELPSDTWSVRNTYSYDEYGNWNLFDFSGEPMSLAHSGTKSALVQIGIEEEDVSVHQDEWLIVRPGEGAEYMDFWYFLHPELREVGGYQDFPDHYYVLISFDNGSSWEELWDGRWDMGPAEGMQQASLFLGSETDNETLVAFRALSADDQSLYFLWSVDDVEFFSAEEMDTRKITTKTSMRHALPENISGLPLKRDFVPSGFMSKAHRIPQNEWLNNGNITYRIYLDGEMIADYLKARCFTDYTTKEPGMHTYEVMAWSEAMDEEFEGSSIDVEIGEEVFPAPRNVRAEYVVQDDGKFTVQATWEAPEEDDPTPTHYQVYLNGKQLGWIDALEELAIGQSGLYKGVYTFEVEAAYTLPEGTSKRISATVFPGTVPVPGNLELKGEGDGVSLTWEAPATDGVTGYSVYRGNELLSGNIKETSYSDAAAPAGNYLYSVRAHYEDGEVSLPASVPFVKDGFDVAALPLEENFDNGLLPANWNVELVDPYGRVKDMYAWRFDNWFGMEVPESAGFEGDFASISGVAAGMNSLQCHVVSPEVMLPEDGSPCVRFSKYFMEEKEGPTGPALFVMSVSCDEGMNWTEIADVRALPDGGNEVSLDAYKGKRIMVRWSFLGRNSGEAAIDNVMILADSNSIDGVSSDSGVYDIYTLDGILKAKSVRLSASDALPAGIYILKGEDGSMRKILRK